MLSPSLSPNLTSFFDPPLTHGLLPFPACASPSVNPNLSPVFDVVIGHTDDAQPPLPLASDGVLRWVWQSRFGAILIEVIADEVFVNGQRVLRHAP